MTINFFKHQFMIHGIHSDFSGGLSLTYYEWDNSLHIMKVPRNCVFVSTYMTGDSH